MKKCRPSIQDQSIHPLPMQDPPAIPHQTVNLKHKGLIRGAFLQSECLDSSLGLKTLCKKRICSSTLNFMFLGSLSRPSTVRAIKHAQRLKRVRRLTFTDDNWKQIIFLKSFTRKLNRLDSITIIFKIQHNFPAISSREIQEVFESLPRSISSLKIRTHHLIIIKEDLFFHLLYYMTRFMRTLLKLKTFDFRIGEGAYQGRWSPMHLQRNSLDNNYQTPIHQMQKCLRKIDRLESFTFLNSSGDYSSLLDSFLYNSRYFSNLQSLELGGVPIDRIRSIVDQTNQSQSLSLLVLRYTLDPQDVLDLIASIPSLRKFIIRESWFHSNQELQTGQHNDVTALDFDLALDLESKDDVEFISSFLGHFQRLISLKIYLRSSVDISSLTSKLNALGREKRLQELVLGLDLDSGDKISDALNQLRDITDLIKCTLIIKLSAKSTWQGSLPLVFTSVAGFIRQNTKLRKLELFVERLSPHHTVEIVQLIKILPRLDYFMFSFSPRSYYHGESHGDTLRGIEKVFLGYNGPGQVFIEIACQEEFCRPWSGSCESIASTGENTNKIRFRSSSRIRIPFHNQMI